LKRLKWNIYFFSFIKCFLRIFELIYIQCLDTNNLSHAFSRLLRKNFKFNSWGRSLWEKIKGPLKKPHKACLISKIKLLYRDNKLYKVHFTYNLEDKFSKYFFKIISIVWFRPQFFFTSWMKVWMNENQSLLTDVDVWERSPPLKELASTSIVYIQLSLPLLGSIGIDITNT